MHLIILLISFISVNSGWDGNCLHGRLCSGLSNGLRVVRFRVTMSVCIRLHCLGDGLANRMSQLVFMCEYQIEIRELTYMQAWCW